MSSARSYHRGVQCILLTQMDRIQHKVYLTSKRTQDRPICFENPDSKKKSRKELIKRAYLLMHELREH